jgi:Cu/Ag efflux protein CusF
MRVSDTVSKLLAVARYSVFIGALLGTLGCFACRKAQLAEKDYALRGTVVSLDTQTKTATIKHEKIGDWMEAMTMEFPVRDPAEFTKLRAGQKITATVHTRPDTFEYWISDIHQEAP